MGEAGKDVPTQQDRLMAELGRVTGSIDTLFVKPGTKPEKGSLPEGMTIEGILAGLNLGGDVKSWKVKREEGGKFEIELKDEESNTTQGSVEKSRDDLTSPAGNRLVIDETVLRLRRTEVGSRHERMLRLRLHDTSLSTRSGDETSGQASLMYIDPNGGSVVHWQTLRE